MPADAYRDDAIDILALFDVRSIGLDEVPIWLNTVHGWWRKTKLSLARP